MVTVLFTFLLLLCQPVASQSPFKNSGQRVEPEGSPDLERWRLLLNELKSEARTLQPEEKRPAIIAEVADAYWDLDKNQSEELFIAALETGLSLKAKTREERRAAQLAVKQVLSLAAKRDASLSRRLTEMLMEQRLKEGQTSSELVETALDLLKSDPKRAAQLIETGALAGPSMDTAWFTFELVKLDPAAAERIYRAYLGKVANNQSFPLERLLWLAGYAFGYGEAYGGTFNVTKMSGFGGFRIPELSPNPNLAGAFLDIAFQAVQNTLKQAASAPAPAGDDLSSLALFAVLYLFPEVARYRPNAMQEWQSLYSFAISITSEARRAVVEKRLQQIIESRARASKYESSESDAAQGGQAKLEVAEKLPEGCQRDRSYAEAAVGFASTKDFLQAIKLAERISNLSIRNNTLQFIYYDMSSEAIASGDIGGLGEAEKQAGRVASREQRALLHVKIAKAALLHKDISRAAELLGTTRRLAENVSEQDTKAGVLLAAAAVLAKFDLIEADSTLRDAIKVVNRMQDYNVDSFSVSRKIDLACEGEKSRWYGSFDQAEQFSLIETLASIAPMYVEGTLAIARSIENPGLRIRALASVARAMTQEQKKLSTKNGQ
jgi:hypothetical protein